jgi:membrane fusion protein, macrolide-specific efflux system
MSKKNLLIGLCILITAIGIWFFLGRAKKTDGAVKIIKPFYGHIETSITATGTVQPQNRLEIKPPIGGRIEKILVVEGQKVKAGDVLALMSSTERAALLDAAQLQGGDTLKKWEDVYKPTPLLAPIDGEVIVKAVNPGQTVTTADAVIVLSDRLIVQAQVDETDIGKVKLGQDAVITLDAYADINVKAKVDHVYYESKTVNNVTIYQVDIVPQTVPDVFRSGMSANVRIIRESKDNVLLLPETVVKNKDGKSFVLLGRAKGAKPQEKDIITGLSDGINIEIKSGLTENDKVVEKTATAYEPSKKAAATSPFMPSGPRRAH